MTTKFLYQPDKVLDQLLDAVCAVDAEGRFVFINAACEHLFGYTQEELIGRNMIDLVHPEDRELTLQTASKIMRGQPSINFENRYIRKNGTIVHMMWSARWSETDCVRLAIARDITEFKRNTFTQDALYQILEAVYVAEDLFTLCQKIHHIIDNIILAEFFIIALYDNSNDSLSFPYLFNKQLQQHASILLEADTPLAQVILGNEALLCNSNEGNGFLDAISTESTHITNCLAIPLNSQTGTIGAMVLGHGPALESYTEEDKRLLQVISIRITEAIEKKKTEIHLRHMAGHDPLTNLPNRMLFHDRLETALKRARRDKEHLALLYLDLDNFKHINDTFGHEIGDMVLCEVAHRLTKCVREADTISRRGGDEFTVLLTNIQSAEIVATVVKKIHASLDAPFLMEGKSLTISVSIGSSVYPEHGEESQRLFRYADANMYTAKRSDN